jgi:hypothetical protein
VYQKIAVVYQNVAVSVSKNRSRVSKNRSQIFVNMWLAGQKIVSQRTKNRKSEKGSSCLWVLLSL